MASCEVPDEILLDQLSHLIEQVGATGICHYFDRISKYDLTMLVCKATELGSNVMLLPAEQRLNMLKYLGSVKKMHSDSLDIALHRSINNLIATITFLSRRPAEHNEIDGSTDAQGSNEVTVTEGTASEALKGTESTVQKSEQQSSAAPKLRESAESNHDASSLKNGAPQEGKLDDVEIANEIRNSEQSESHSQSADAVITMSTDTSREEENAKTTAEELTDDGEHSSLETADDTSETEAKPIISEVGKGTSPGDFFHVSSAECMFAAESLGKRFVKREMIIPKSLSASIFGQSGDAAAMVEVLTNTVISLRPPEENESWQRLVIAGRYKAEVDKTICFIHFLLKYRIKMDFAKLASVCCKFRQANKQKRKQFTRREALYKGIKPLTDKSQVTRATEAPSESSAAGRGITTGREDVKYQPNTTKTQLEIPNSSVGKIMGDRGCIAALIENLTKGVVSFQRAMVAKDRRILYLKAQTQQDLNCVQELIMLTLKNDIQFGLLTDVLYWGTEHRQSKSFQELADNMNSLPGWETRKDKCYQEVWMAEGRPNIRQLLLKKSERQLRGPFEMSIRLRLPCTTGLRRSCVTGNFVSIQPRTSSNRFTRGTQKRVFEKDKTWKMSGQGKKECHPNLVCNHDYRTLVLHRANFLMAALDRSTTAPIEGNCQLLCEILHLNRAKKA